MSAKMVYVISIPTPLPPRPGKPPGKRWNKVGAVVQLENGQLAGNITLVPFAGWDGRFLLFPPGKVTEPAQQENNTDDIDQPPW